MQRFKKAVCVFLFFLMPILVAACQQEQQAHDDHAGHEMQNAPLKLSLNDGQKWQMDEHTRNSINTLHSIFELSEPVAVEDFNAIGKETDAEVNNLIAGCTMEGGAHEQLHLFLGAFIPKVKGLKVAENTEKAEKLYLEIDQMLLYYDKYFE